jgi:uncharacterized protein YdeI (YjbR/CyaY-like superfamily)
MAPIAPRKETIRSFKTEADFERWLSKYHDREAELWLRFYKKDSGVPTVNYAQALDVALCWGWIDGLRKRFDEKSFIQRFTPRRPKSIWSQINRDHVQRLIKAGRMTPNGQREIDAAKADGRWDAASRPISSLTSADVPKDLLAAIKKSPRAAKTFQTLKRRDLLGLILRTTNMKTAAGRERKIAELVEELERTRRD